MTTYLPTAKPAWAVVCWVDDNSVFIELPVKDGPPFIQSFALTEGGLSKALTLMRQAHKREKPKGGYFTIPAHPLTKKAVAYTDAQRAAAANVLKRLKIT